MPDPQQSENEIAVGATPHDALDAAVREAAAWGGELCVEGAGGRLRLPILAGLRRGMVSGRLALEPCPGGTHLRFTAEESVYYLHTPAVAVLVLAALGALVCVAWPLYPRLLPVAPLGAVLAIGGWLLVLARLRNSGPREFLESLAAGLAAHPPSSAGPPGQKAGTPRRSAGPPGQ